MTRIISFMKKWPNLIENKWKIIGNLGLIVFQTALVVFLNASFYGLDPDGRDTVSFWSEVVGIFGVGVYVWAVKMVKGKSMPWGHVGSLGGMFLLAVVLKALELANLIGWNRLVLSIVFQFVSLSLGWLASERLSAPTVV